ncbi:MAG: hypothetical protein ACI9LY_000124 [Arenicella sp.]|jgi:hypothetical protein
MGLKSSPRKYLEKIKATVAPTVVARITHSPPTAVPNKNPAPKVKKKLVSKKQQIKYR